MPHAKSKPEFCGMKKNFYLLVVLLLATTLFAFYHKGRQQPDQYAVEGIAISGYDAVAYFEEGKAVKGDSSIKLKWNGVTWYFSKEKYLDLFETNPQKYAPQYGGYCAYGASNGYKAKTDPNAWTIVGQKLYLNYNKQVKQTWLPDTATRIPAADQYWKKVLNNN
jgi:YHS domain-containing protein